MLLRKNLSLFYGVQLLMFFQQLLVKSEEPSINLCTQQANWGKQFSASTAALILDIFVANAKLIKRHQRDTR